MVDRDEEIRVVVGETFKKIGLGEDAVRAVEEDPSALVKVISARLNVTTQEAESILSRGLEAGGFEGIWNERLAERFGYSGLPGKKGSGTGDM